MVTSAIPRRKSGHSEGHGNSRGSFNVGGLYRKFREPLDNHPALSAAPPEVRDWLGRFLWGAMLAGPAVEGEALDGLTRHGLRPDQLELLRKCYLEHMRPQITDEERERARQAVLKTP